jgi:hypothetical protein
MGSTKSKPQQSSFNSTSPIKTSKILQTKDIEKRIEYEMSLEEVQERATIHFFTASPILVIKYKKPGEAK